MDTRRCEVLSTASEPTPEVPTDPPHTPPFGVREKMVASKLHHSSSIYLGYLYVPGHFNQAFYLFFFAFGFMIPCLQPDSASERAKKKKKLQVVFHTPQGPFLADRLVFCEPVYCTVPEKHDAGIMRIGNCFNAYCIYLAS